MRNLEIVCALVLVCVDLVYSGSCTACRKGLPRHDCTDKYNPPSPYVIDEGLCKNIREKRSGGNSEEMNLFKRYGGNYQILCELDDLSQISCVGVRVVPSRRVGGGGRGGSPAHQVCLLLLVVGVLSSLVL